MKPIRVAVALGAAALFLGGLAAPAFAADNGSNVAATAGITAGDRTATLAGAIAFPAVNADHNIQSATAQSTSIEVNDLSASDAGWNVTVVSSALVGTSGPALSLDGTIAGNNLSVASYGALAVVSTDTVGVVSGIAPGTPGTIGTPITLLTAPVGYGVGDYTQAFNVGLSMPADSLAGDYAGTLTVTIAPAS
jgi:hypothetical protein